MSSHFQKACECESIGRHITLTQALCIADLVTYFFNQLHQAMLYEVRGLPAIASVAIAHSEQVAVGRLVDVWVQDEAILVHFVWVIRDVPNSGGERVFSDHVPFDV